MFRVGCCVLLCSSVACDETILLHRFIQYGRCLFVWEREEGVFGGQRRRRSKVARFWLDRRSEIIDLIQETELLSPIPIHSYIQVWEGGKNSLSVE